MAAELPNQPYVTLSEALSWIAFATPLGRESLNKELAGLTFKMELSAAKAQLEQGVSNFMDAAAVGKIQIVGKHLLSHLADPDESKVDIIPEGECQNYRQFDITIDGLRFGEGLAWLPNENEVWAYEANKHPDFYTQIKVKRSSLMHAFSARIIGMPANAQSKLPPLSETDLKNWWDKLTIEEQRQSRKALGELCAVHHPLHSISRQRVRTLTPNRKRGPKTNQPK